MTVFAVGCLSVLNRLSAVGEKRERNQGISVSKTGKFWCANCKQTQQAKMRFSENQLSLHTGVGRVTDVLGPPQCCSQDAQSIVPVPPGAPAEPDPAPCFNNIAGENFYYLFLSPFLRQIWKTYVVKAHTKMNVWGVVCNAVFAGVGAVHGWQLWVIYDMAASLYLAFSRFLWPRMTAGCSLQLCASQSGLLPGRESGLALGVCVCARLCVFLSDCICMT